MRLAVFGPWPPQRTGIADYSALLLPALAAHHEIEVFAEGREAPVDQVEKGVRIRAVGDFAEPHRTLPIYQIGNHADFHRQSYGLLRRYPGVVLLHEVMIHHLVRDVSMGQGGPEAYGEILRSLYGATGRAAAEDFTLRGLPPELWRLPLFEEAVDRSLAVVVHNDFSRDRILASRPLAWVETIPHPVARPRAPLSLEDNRRVRGELGLPEDAILVGTFGYLTVQKRFEMLLRVFARLRSAEPRAHLLLVGALSGDYDPSTRPGGPGVVATGRVGTDRFLELMAATDVAVNLRYPSGGETSGTLMQLLALGRPVIVNDHGSFAELPDRAVAKVAPDPAEEETLFAFLEALVGSRGLRRQMGEAARDHILSRCGLDSVTAHWNRFLGEVAEKARPPTSPVPPLAPYPPSDVATNIVADLAAAAADLGVAEDDAELLPDLAAMLVELGVDPGR